MFVTPLSGVASRYRWASALVNRSRSWTVTVSAECPFGRRGDGTFSWKWKHRPALAFVPNVSPSSFSERLLSGHVPAKSARSAVLGYKVVGIFVVGVQFGLNSPGLGDFKEYSEGVALAEG